MAALVRGVPGGSESLLIPGFAEEAKRRRCHYSGFHRDHCPTNLTKLLLMQSLTQNLGASFGLESHQDGELQWIVYLMLPATNDGCDARSSGLGHELAAAASGEPWHIWN